MQILLCCPGEGLWTFSGRWRQLPCPLPRPSLIAINDRMLAAADTEHSLAWCGSVMPIDRGAEVLLTEGSHVLTLSGETDCLSLLDARTGQLLIAAPAGVHPQDLCRAGALLAVCGGADGTVRLMHPATLHTVGLLHLPGHTQRIAWSGGCLYVLCAMYDEALHCLLYAIPADGRAVCLLRMPGLAGALCADGFGGVWAAASETLLHLPARTGYADRQLGGTGLIRHMMCSRRHLLISDPVMGFCRLYGPDGRIITERHGDVGQAMLAE